MNHPMPYYHLEKLANQLEQASLTVRQLLEAVELPAHESWEALERQADADIAAGRVQTFQTADELFRALEA
jgi:hypothetical protein